MVRIKQLLAGLGTVVVIMVPAWYSTHWSAPHWHLPHITVINLSTEEK